MDKDEGRLDRDQKAKIIEWLEKKTDGRPIVCPICGHQEWLLADHLVAPPRLKGNGFWLGAGPIYPLVVLFCQKCAHSAFFNAVMIGIMPAKEAPSSLPEPEESNANG